MNKKMNPHAEIEKAAEEYCANEHTIDGHDSRPSTFIAGALSPEAQRYWENGERVQMLVKALEKCKRVLLPENGWCASDYLAACDALESWKEANKFASTVATNPSDSECATTRTDDE